jgi:hypothetical protein
MLENFIIFFFKFQIFIKFLNFQKFHKISKKFKMIKFSKTFKNYSKIEPCVIKQILHLNLINMRFYGAEYNNIELVFASFNIVVLCSIP